MAMATGVEMKSSGVAEARAKVGTTMSLSNGSSLGGVIGSGTCSWMTPGPPGPPWLAGAPIPPFPEFGDPLNSGAPFALRMSRRAVSPTLRPSLVKSICVADSRITWPPEPLPPVPPTWSRKIVFSPVPP